MISVGRIDAVIPDNLETQFRMEIIKRFGGRKGDLQRAVVEAIKLWIESDIIKELEKTATSERRPSTQRLAIRSLIKMGEIALPALSRISNNTNLTDDSRDESLSAIIDILAKKRAREKRRS